MKIMKAGTFHYGLALVVMASIETAPVEAFVERRLLFSPSSMKLCRSSPALYSSLDDDELSKLIGKRSQIKRKKKEELPKEDDFLDSLDASSCLLYTSPSPRDS